MSYTLIAKNSLHHLLEVLDEQEFGPEQDPARWMEQETLLIVQSSHLLDWLGHRQAESRRVHFPPQSQLSDAGIRLLLEAFLSATADLDPALAELAGIRMLHTDSLSLLILNHLAREPAKGLLGEWLGGKGRRQLDLYSLSHDIADAFNSYALNQGDLDQDARSVQGQQSFESWQVELWRQLFGPGARVLPMGLVLHRVLGLMRKPGLRDALALRLETQSISLKQGRPLDGITIFGSAFLPLLSLEFIHTLASLGGQRLWIRHYLFVPFRTASEQPNRDSHGLHAALDSWASLGDGLLARLSKLGVPLPDNFGLPGTPREPVWNGTPVRVIACPNRRREVEILKEEILALLDTDPHLAPNRIAVLCPTPEDYRPYIEALFPARGPGLDGNDELPWHFLDTASDPTDFESALELILSIPGSSLGRSTVSALLGRNSFCRAFGLDKGDVELIRQWIDASGARDWLDPDHKASAGLPMEKDGTWSATLDRLALGQVYGTDPGLWDRSPLGGGMTAGPTLSRLVRLLGSLDNLARGASWSQEKSFEDWGTQVRLFCLGKDAQFFDEGQDQAEEEAKVQRLLRAEDEDRGPVRLSKAISALVQLTLDTESFGKDAKIDFTLYRSMLIEQLDGQVRGGGQALLQGICIARFQPFRLIPFEHLFCLGMDEGAFPAGEERRSLYQFIPGAPTAKNQRPQDLYSFLETFATFRKTLTILYQGRDPATRALRLPSAPVASLAASVPHMVHRQEAGLHAFDQAELPPDLAGLDPPWTVYQSAGIRNQRHRSIIAGAEDQRPASEDQELTSTAFALDTRDLDDLLTKPLRFHGRKRLGIKLGDQEDDMAVDAMLFAPERWERSKAGSQVLGAYFAGKTEDEILSTIEDAYKDLVRQGIVAKGHFFEGSLASVLEQGRKKYQTLARAFGSSRIQSLGQYLARDQHNPCSGLGPLAFRFPPYQPAVFGPDLTVSGSTEPWLVRTDAEVPEVFTLEETSNSKPERSRGLKVMGRLLAMAAWLSRPEHQGRYALWQLGTIFLSKKAGQYQEIRAGFKTVEQWCQFLPLVEDLARRAWSGPLPLLGDMFDDADLFASLCADGVEDPRSSPAGIAAFQEYFSQNSTLDTGGYQNYTAIPGNCPYFRLFYGPALGPCSHEPWESEDLGSTYTELARLARDIISTSGDSAHE